MAHLSYNVFASLTRFVNPWERLNLVVIGAGPGASTAISIDQCLAKFPAAQICVVAGNAAARSDLAQRFSASGSVRFTAADAVTNLDRWARDEKVERPDIVCLDAYAITMDRVRTLTPLLEGGCAAVHCRAPWSAAGGIGACFTDVAAFLSQVGFELYQLHDVIECGAERRIGGIEAVFLSRPTLMRAAKMSAQELELGVVAEFRQLLARCGTMGFSRVAIYGAGKDLRARAAALAEPAVTIDCIIDDSPGSCGAQFMSLPIVPLSGTGGALARGVDCIVIASSGFEDRMVENCERLLANAATGVAVVPMRHNHPRFIGRHPLIRCEHQPARPASEMEAKTVVHSPLEVFHSQSYLRITDARLRHLASLKLDPQICGRSVLEVGAGVGDLTGFFADRGCRVLATDVRQENVDVMRERFAGSGRVRPAVLDLERIAAGGVQQHDIVFCYGVLYHLERPAEAIKSLSRLCREMIVIETCVSFGDHEAINLIGENAADPSQAARGTGCRPTRPWMLARLAEHFKYVYMPVTQPSHPEFPLDWSAGNPGSMLHRAVFIGSREPVANPRLEATLLTYQGEA